MKRRLGTLYAEQGAPYCARESRGKDIERGREGGDAEQKKEKDAPRVEERRTD